VLPSRDRAPVWPAGLVGSIAHTSDRAVAAVAVSEQTAGIGLDLEDVRRVASAPVEGLVADAEERRWIAGDPIHLIKLFSAKEAIFKAFYPRHGSFFDFDAVHLDAVPDGFVATLRLALADWPAGSRCLVRCRDRGHHVLASVLLPPLAPTPA
jgi:4'-phosphopantetheinyl transferase EntD